MAESEKYGEVVAYLIALRQEKRLHQADVAQRLGVRQQVVSRIENKLKRLDVAEFYDYCRALGVDPTEVIGEVYRRFRQLG